LGRSKIEKFVSVKKIPNKRLVIQRTMMIHPKRAHRMATTLIPDRGRCRLGDPVSTRRSKSLSVEIA